MKKVLAIVLVLGLVFMFSGCLGPDLTDAQNSLVDATEDFMNGDTDLSDLEDTLKDYADTISGNVQGFSNISDYIKVAQASDDFKKVVKNSADNGMTLTLEAEGDNLVYKYVYTVPVVDNASELIEQSFESSASALQAAADTIRIEAPCVKKVVWKYYTMDGKLITSVSK